MPPLPAASPQALDHSEAVSRALAGEIAAAGGWISLARFMELALYAPGLGYYSAGLDKFGAGGDFVTAPEISTLFGRTLARQVAQVLELTGGDILEVGAGSGKLAVDLMLELARLERLPGRYAILELSADLRTRQRQRVEKDAPHLASRFCWLDSLPERFTGLILGNEVLDAMPVHGVVWRRDGIRERGVAMEGLSLAWSERPLAQGELLRHAAALPPARFVGASPVPYRSEIGLAGQGFVRSLGKMLDRGAILLVDYGFGESEYYHPQRSEGTLMCHFRHHAHGDPFFLPGLQDITAHVDFSAMARAGREAGLDLLGYTSQARFLVNCGLTDLLAGESTRGTAAYLPLAAQAQKLVSPAEMGELFKTLALGKGLVADLRGFAQGDQRHRL